jgi:hypothetical protein
MIPATGPNDAATAITMAATRGVASAPRVT